MSVLADSRDTAALPGYLLDLHMRISPEQYRGVGLKSILRSSQEFKTKPLVVWLFDFHCISRESDPLDVDIS